MKKIYLVNGGVCLVDNRDFYLVSCFNWHARKRGNNFYAERYSNGRIVYMHRFILGCETGTIVDHKNGNGLDNRRTNIRLCSRTENNRNKRIQHNNKSGFKGVVHVDNPKSHKKWKAIIKVDGRSKSLGYFYNKIDAALCYNLNAQKYFGKFACLNEVMV